MYKFRKNQKFVKLSSLLVENKKIINKEIINKELFNKELFNKALMKLKNGELKFINIDLFHYGTNNIPRIAYDPNKNFIGDYYIDIHHNRYKMHTDFLEISDKRGEITMLIKADHNTVTIILNDKSYFFNNIDSNINSTQT